jgi:hypothetical protein
MRYNLRLVLVGIIIAVLAFGTLSLPITQNLAKRYTPQTAIGQYTRELIIGFVGTAEAATADYQCDGVDDNVQWQQALNALPSGGGKIIGLAGNYNFGATISRAINNVTIEGLGKSTYFAYNNSAALFSAGTQTGWLFVNIATDGGWLTLASDTLVINCWKVGVLTDTHAALTTGVHGIDNLLSFIKSWYHEDWKTLDKWTSYVTGTGGYDWYSPSDLRLKTGTTSLSNSCLDTPQIGPLCLRDSGNQWYFRVQAGSDLGSSEVRLYAPRSDAAKPPSDTFYCVGWKIINGEIYAHTADGTTAKDTDTGISMASIWTTKELFTVCDTDGVVKFYVDGVLKATHSGAADYVPAHFNGRFSFNIKNTAAADKQIAFLTFNWRT